MNQSALAQLFFGEIGKIVRQKDSTIQSRIEALLRLLQLLFVELTRKEKIQFSTLFARIAYAGQKFDLNRKRQFYVHHFRKLATTLNEQNGTEEEATYALGIKVLAELISESLESEIPTDLRPHITSEWPITNQPAVVAKYIPKARVVALEDDMEKKLLLIRDEANPEDLRQVQYNIPERNAHFNPTIEVLRKVFAFPVTLNLLDIEVDKAGIYRPRAMVVEPDFLLDVSAIAECFKAYGTEPYLYLLKKYLPFRTSKPLMIGNIANFFLDELMGNPEQDFKTLFPKVFQLNPLSFCLFSDREVKEIMQACQKHYVNLKRMVLQDFQAEGIQPEDCYLESTFYSENYGIQGRLDVFYLSPNGDKKSAIVELKSGKTYMPNIYGISPNHFTQTLLYDLLIRSTFGKKLNPVNYILYSGSDEKPLRFAPVIQAQQFEAIQVRNQLLALERLLTNHGLDEENDLLAEGQKLLAKLNPQNFPKARGFVQRDLNFFAKVYQGMTSLEKKYFVAFSGFIAREHQLAKTGLQGVDNVNGQASVWLNSFSEKQEHFDLISHLEILDKKVHQEDPVIHFTRTEQTNPLANFRKGDIAILYPFTGEFREVLTNQVFKCTIIELNAKEVKVRLRSKVFNEAIFNAFVYWNLEHDLLDSGFVGMYRGLFEFAMASPEKRALLLTEKAPKEVELLEIPEPSGMTEEQVRILKKALSAEDYFLIWGPPGTGKTSVMLKELVAYLVQHTEENVLLLAYTNRAVDEICHAIERIGECIKDQYLRIGSRYATAEKFKDRLFSSKIAKVKSRKELKSIIDKHRIFVGTVSSLSSRGELFQLKHFQRVIIDEASQILEPMLVGLLNRFERFILIGDHKQLPAVVVQDADFSKVEDQDLRQIGMANLRNSLFERLYLRCMKEKWHWAYDQLSHQGRMHKELMAFPNHYFYQGTLSILPEAIPHSKVQKAKLLEMIRNSIDPLEQMLGQHRILFIPTPVDYSNPGQKTNQYEAALVAKLIQSFQNQPQRQEKPLAPSDLGVITPYRAQIAQIRAQLQAVNIDSDQFTIDTVERYQGGARKIILISLCTNSLSQLRSMSSLSIEGVDRKLNVALTRAKEQLIILGNREILITDPIYKALIESCVIFDND